MACSKEQVFKKIIDDLALIQMRVEGMVSDMQDEGSKSFKMKQLQELNKIVSDVEAHAFLADETLSDCIMEN